jgi:hypothetical protein
MEFNKKKVRSVLSKASDFSSKLEVQFRAKHQIMDLISKSLNDDIVVDHLVNSLETVFNTVKIEVIGLVSLVSVRYESECTNVMDTFNELEGKDKEDIKEENLAA